MAETLGLGVNVATVIELVIKLGVHCSVYCAGVKTAPQDIRSLLREADKFTVSLKDIARLISGANGTKIDASQSLYHNINDCKLLLETLVAKLKQGTAWERVIWPLKKGEVGYIIETLGRCRASIVLDLQVHQTLRLRDDHQESVLAKLRTAKQATFDSYANSSNSQCYPGTRREILQQVLEWGAAHDNANIFWLNGMAGTGKSTISHTMAQAFTDKRVLGASFFFKHGEGDRGHATFFFPTIIAQLVRQVPLLAVHVCNEIEADAKICEKSISNQFEQLIVNPIRKLTITSSPSVKIIVLDALDECDSLEDARLIIHLLSLTKQFKGLCLKFFVTSRPELPIQLGFKDIHAKYEILILHEVPQPVIRHDIALFLEHKLKKIRDDYNKFAAPSRQLSVDWPGLELTQKLVDMAVPLFIFATTSCRFIEDRRLGGPNEQLRLILASRGGRKCKLDKTYLPVLDGLFVELHESEKREVAKAFRRVVGSIVLLATPLSPHSLSRLVDLPLETIENQLDLFHSVLSISVDPDLPVRLLHLSFRDFVTDADNETELFWVDERQTHGELAMNCLRLLSTAMNRDVCELGLPGTCRSEVNRQTINAKLLPEVQYACRYWVYHCKEAKIQIQDGTFVHLFLTQNLLYWLEALGLLGCISDSVEMINDLLTLADNLAGKSVVAFLRDARRIILTHRSVIDMWPLQVYYSALIFTPQQSVIRNTFPKQFPVWISPLPQVDIEWDSCMQTLEGHGDSIRSINMLPNSTSLASASDDGTVRIWDITKGGCITTLRGHENKVRSVTVSHDSRIIASASVDTTIKLWDITTSLCTATLRCQHGPVPSVVFSHDSKILASAAEDVVKLWDVASYRHIATLKGHSGQVRSVAFSNDSTILASASADMTVKLWDIVKQRSIATLKGHSGHVHSVAFLHDSNTLASASDDQTIKLWDIATYTCTVSLYGHNGTVRSLAFSRNSTILASSSDDGTVKLWDTATGICIETLQGHSDWVRSVAFSPDSNILASASDDRTVKLWDITSSIHIHSTNYGSHDGPVRSVTFSHDSSILATSSDDRNIKLWDTTTGICTVTLNGHTDLVWSVEFSHNSNFLLSASADKTVKLWDIESEMCAATLFGHRDWVRSAIFSHDSRTLASSSGDKTVRLWDTTTFECTSILEGHQGPVGSIAFSHNSRILASGSRDNTIKLWDTLTGLCTATLAGHGDWVRSLSFSPNSTTTLVSASRDRIIKLWHGGICIETIDVGMAISHVAFDEAGSMLYTDAGVFELNGQLSPTPLEATALKRKEPCRIGLSKDRTWVTDNLRRVLWLPLAYRPMTFAVKASKLAIGTRLGRVVIVSISLFPSLH